MIFLVIGLLLVCIGIVGFVWCSVQLIHEEELLDDKGENENEL